MWGIENIRGMSRLKLVSVCLGRSSDNYSHLKIFAITMCYLEGENMAPEPNIGIIGAGRFSVPRTICSRSGIAHDARVGVEFYPTLGLILSAGFPIRKSPRQTSPDGPMRRRTIPWHKVFSYVVSLGQLGPCSTHIGCLFTLAVLLSTLNSLIERETARDSDSIWQT